MSRLPIATIGRRVVSITARMLRADKAGDDLPLLHRLAIIYLMIPVVIWLVGWFRWWFGIPAAILIILALRPALSGSIRLTPPRPMILAVVLFAALWVTSSAAGGVFDATNSDWNKHRWILLNLGYYSWPTIIPDFLAPYLTQDSQWPFLLRYYLGWYMVPGSVARLVGSDALNWAVPLWTWLGISLILLLFVQKRRGWGVIIALAIFIFFSGMDLVRLILRDSIDTFGFHNIWSGPGEIRAHYLSTMRSFHWAPQHLVPAAMYTLLLLQLRRHPRFLRVSAVLLAVAPFWSPFVAIGLLPFIAVLIWKNRLRRFLGWSSLALAPALAGLIAVYLTSGSQDHAQGWIWAIHDWTTLARLIPPIYLAEFLFLGLLLCVFRPNLLRLPFFIASLATLSLLPIYHFGEYNDLAMRGALPALFVLCYYCTNTILDKSRLIFSGHASWWRCLSFAGIAVALAIGSLSAINELALNISKVSPFRYEQGYYTSTLNVAPEKLDQYLANIHEIPSAIRLLLDTDALIVLESENGQLLSRTYDRINPANAPNLPSSFQVFSQDTLSVIAAARQIVGIGTDPIFLGFGDYGPDWVRYLFPGPSGARYIRMFDSKRSIIFPADPRGASYLFAFELPDPSIMDRYFDQPSAETVGTAPSGRPIILHRLLNRLPPFDPDSPVRAQFGDHILLYGFDMPDNARAGTIMTVRWYWRILTSDQWELAFSNQLFGWDGDRRGQLDDRPFAPNYWPAGTSGISTFEIEVDPEAPTGAYWLRVAMYDRNEQDISNLPVFDAQGNQAGNQLILGPIKVHGQPPAPSSQGPVSDPPVPDNLLPARFDDQIDLQGYSLSVDRLLPGESLDLTLFWAPRGRPMRDYTVFVHILDGQGQLRSQADSPPMAGKYPTSVWDAGEFIEDLHTVSLPPNLPAGDYTFAIGLYDPQTGQRLPIMDANGQRSGDNIIISGLVVEGR